MEEGKVHAWAVLLTQTKQALHLAEASQYLHDYRWKQVCSNKDLRGLSNIRSVSAFVHFSIHFPGKMIGWIDFFSRGTFDTIVVGFVNFLESSSHREERRVIVHRHPEYDNKTLVNDVAVLQLRSPVEFDDFVRPACIASSTPETNHYSECMVAGWGSLPAGIKPNSHHIKIASFDVNLICFSFRKFMNITKRKEELTFVTCLLSGKIRDIDYWENHFSLRRDWFLHKE